MSPHRGGAKRLPGARSAAAGAPRISGRSPSQLGSLYPSRIAGDNVPVYADDSDIVDSSILIDVQNAKYVTPSTVVAVSHCWQSEHTDSALGSEKH
jgi:hypothetical protein